MDLRIKSEKTKEEFISSLKYIFPTKDYRELSESEISSVNKEKKYLFRSNDKLSLIAILYSHNKKKEPAIGFKLQLFQEPLDIDIDFGNTFCKVFNDDLNMLPEKFKFEESWISFRESQFRRSIAKFSAFSTEPMIQWIQTVENSISLKYEGHPFIYCLFMTKQKKWIKGPLENEFLEFSKPIPFEQALLKEKWIRAIDGGRISLTGLGHKGNIIGMFSIPENEKKDQITLSPHEELESVVQTLVPGTCVFFTTEEGDIYLMLPNDITFLKTKGKWHYLNYDNILKTLTNLLDENIAASILRLTLNLSYDRHGAMILIPDDIKEVDEIIPDYNDKDKANKNLRDSIKGVTVTDRIQRKLISSTAKIDGATIISKSGNIIDAACMISEPKKNKLEKVGVPKLKRFSGARTTAAWNASIYGTAIKISEDGPIKIFRHGKLISKVG